MQQNFDVCKMSDISIALAAPIITVYNDKFRKEIVVYGGGSHLGKDSDFTDQK